MKLNLSTKGQTLENKYYKKNKYTNFLSQQEISKNKTLIINKIIKSFKNDKIIVRSSAADEDGKNFQTLGNMTLQLY